MRWDWQHSATQGYSFVTRWVFPSEKAECRVSLGDLLPDQGLTVGILSAATRIGKIEILGGMSLLCLSGEEDSGRLKVG